MMPKLLTRLKITEVSAVDRGAGDGTKILLMKRDDDRRSKPHVERHARRLRKFQEVFDSPERYRRRSFNEIVGKADDRDDSGGVSDHPIAQLAGLLVASGKFSDNAAALHHLLNSPHGNALLARLHKAEAHTGKDHSTMDKTETLRDIAKAGGIIAVAKAIIDENRSYGITEHEFVELATESAQAEFPSLSKAAAFSRVYTEASERGRTLQKAVAVCKAMPFVANVEPLIVGGADTRDLSDQSEAIAQLKQLGARKWPTESAAAQFERALTAPENHKLARLAVPIPQPTTSYPFPR
jgi:hypothetical protein